MADLINVQPPSLNNADLEYTGASEQQFRNVLRLYFSRLSALDKQQNESVNSLNTLAWLNTGN